MKRLAQNGRLLNELVERGFLKCDGAVVASWCAKMVCLCCCRSAVHEMTLMQ